MKKTKVTRVNRAKEYATIDWKADKIDLTRFAESNAKWVLALPMVLWYRVDTLIEVGTHIMRWRVVYKKWKEPEVRFINLFWRTQSWKTTLAGVLTAANPDVVVVDDFVSKPTREDFDRIMYKFVDIDYKTIVFITEDPMEWEDVIKWEVKKFAFPPKQKEKNPLR